MAYQPKNRRKFLATSLSAAVVASAVAPTAGFAAENEFSDVSSDHNYYDVITSLSTAGVVKGMPDGNFDLGGKVTRAQASQMVAKILKLDTDVDNTPFADVKENVWYTDSINALYAKGHIKGLDEDTFAPGKEMTRAEFAQLIVEAYEIPAKDADLPFEDVKEDVWYTDAITTLYAHGLINGQSATEFGPNDTIKRGDFAWLLANTDYKFGDTLEKPAPEVESVSATNPTTLTVTGEDLNFLGTKDITIDGIEVESVTASADGTSATVTLASELTLNKEYTVTVDGEEFTFTFEHSVTSVSLDEKTYDDDTKGQVLSFQVNGDATTADAEWLRQAGYSVNFVAVDSDGAAANDFFEAGTANTSSTGALAEEVAVGEYTVEIQIVKDGEIVVSDETTITVTDLESTTTSISSVELTNLNAALGAPADDFVMNSTTLVTGESADITGIVGDAAGKTDVDLPVSLAKVSSSDSSVISVNNQTLTANAAGTATITVKVGNETKTINLTVKNELREVSEVTPSESTVKVVKGVERIIEVEAFDQYGDPIRVQASTIDEDLPENTSSQPLVSIDDKNATTSHLLTQVDGDTASGFGITGVNEGNGTILFKDADENVVGQIAVEVTDVDNVKYTKIEHPIAVQPVDYEIGVNSSEDYQVSNFNTNDFYNGFVTISGTPTAGQYSVESTDLDIATVTINGDDFTVKGITEGTADIVVKDHNGQVKHTFEVTISEDEVAITNVNFKSTGVIDYVGKDVKIGDFLDVRTDNGNDSIVYGVEHNEDTIAKVRLDDSVTADDENGNEVVASETEPVLYIDKDGSGIRETNEVVLGVVSATPLSGEELTNMTAGTAIDLIAGATTAADDKGSLLFRVIDDANEDGTYAVNETITTTTLNINVK
jgi:hypothetical protein